MGNSIVVIPDYHAHPDYDNERASVIGEFIAARRPDLVVCLGDFADMPSICEHSSKLSLEGARYKEDIAASKDAMQKLLAPIKRRKKGTPKLVMCLGNHEDRIPRLISQDPRMTDVVSLLDLDYERAGWHVVPFKVPIELCGWLFCHYFPSGVLGRAISGANVAKSMVNKLHHSAIQGHSHLAGHHIETSGTGARLHGISAGCVSHPDHIEGWNLNTHKQWWRGILVLDNASLGDASVSFVRLEDL